MGTFVALSPCNACLTFSVWACAVQLDNAVVLSLQSCSVKLGGQA